MYLHNLNMRHRRKPPVFAFLAAVFFAMVSSRGVLCGQVAANANPAAAGPDRLLRDSVDERIRSEQARVARDPEFWVSYNRLASAYAQKARETGDISYFELAEGSLRQSLKLESTHEEAGPAWMQLATVHLAEHRFKEAADEARKAIALMPGNLMPYPYAGDAELEMGDYAAAHELYSHLLEPSDGRPHPGILFLAASHGASLDWIEGRVSQASDDLRHAVDLSRELRLPAENIAWTEFMLGEQFFQSGDLTAAEASEDASLADFPRYHRALAAMGQIRGAQGRLPEAVSWYKQAIAIIPLPVYVAALGDLYSASGDAAQAQKQYALVEYIGKLSAINQQVFNRDLASFYADHDLKLPDSLTLARKELEVRHDVYTSDALAWALLKSGQPEEARTVIEQALRMGTQDALMEYHAGMIYNTLGDRAKATHHLRRALAINPHFHILFAPRAVQTLARLDGKGSTSPALATEATPSHAN